MSSNAFQLADNNLVNEADDYIKKNRLVELFEDLATAVAYRQPENLKEFLIERLENKKNQGLRGGIFKLFDLKQEKKISRERCIKGLQTMANSSFQYENPEESEEIPLEVDEEKFVELCQKFLGFADKEM